MPTKLGALVAGNNAFYSQCNDMNNKFLKMMKDFRSSLNATKAQIKNDGGYATFNDAVADVPNQAAGNNAVIMAQTFEKTKEIIAKVDNLLDSDTPDLQADAIKQIFMKLSLNISLLDRV